MKTLRLLRNIAVLFILVMALLASRPGLGVSSAHAGKSCGPVGSKKGFICTIDASGNCVEFHCGKSDLACNNSGCI
jgi:hypothetical protein